MAPRKHCSYISQDTVTKISDLVWFPILQLYNVLQFLLAKIFSPVPPPPGSKLQRPRIAIIGAGLTGVSAASHCVGHGFDVTIFEQGDEKALGGIWARVNTTSGLQIHSVMYRFHPSVQWEGGYPKQNQIVDQIRQLWERYGLQSRTKFNTKVTQVRKRAKRWIINGNESLGKFDGVIAAIGTCGETKTPNLPGRENFEGGVYHSTQLDGVDAEGKRVLIVGGGASAVGSVEWAVSKKAKEIRVLSRSDKWIIPRNAIVDGLLAFNIFGQETLFSLIPETILRLFFYRDLQDIAPTSQGLFTETPMVNSEIFDLIRDGKASWLRGDIEHVAPNGIQFNRRAKGVPKGGVGQSALVEGDVIIMATGFKRPSLSFLPDKVFEEPYGPPRWYLQVFPPSEPSICANNCTYANAIGTVGNYHIGIYTRLLLMFLVDPLTTPRPFWMRRWIDMTSTLKSLAPTEAFDFFTYSELIYWFTFVTLINPFRWKWALFVFFGIGKDLPSRIVATEDRFRGKDGKGWAEENLEIEGHKREGQKEGETIKTENKRKGGDESERHSDVNRRKENAVDVGQNKDRKTPEEKSSGRDRSNDGDRQDLPSTAQHGEHDQKTPSGDEEEKLAAKENEKHTERVVKEEFLQRDADGNVVGSTIQ